MNILDGLEATMSDPDWAVDYPKDEPRLEPLRHYLEEANLHYQPADEALEGIDRADRDAGIVRVTVSDLRQVLTGSGTVERAEAWRRLIMAVESVQPTYPPAELSDFFAAGGDDE